MNTLPDEVKELVEAILIIGARRANDSLVHDSAKELIKQHIDRLSERVINLYAKAYAPVPGKEELFSDEEIKNMAGHPDATPEVYRIWFLNGFKHCHSLRGVLWASRVAASPSTASNEDKSEETVQTLMQLVRFGWDEAAERILNYCINNKVTPEFSDMIMEMLDEKNKNQFVWEKFESKLKESKTEPKAVQAAKEYAKTDWKNLDGEYVIDSEKYNHFLAGASFNKDAVEFAEWIDANGYECILHTDEHVKIWEGMKTEFKKIYTTEQLYKLYKTKE